jgi:23S rRNA pseudouridine1911/1915/1917 synthase
MRAMNEPGFDILYELHPCLVVSKPPGVLTQAPPGIDSLEVRIKDFLRRRDREPGDVYLGVPHRIDRPASGAMVFGRTRRATRRLAEQFEHRMVRKVYWACVEGQVAPPAGAWRDLLRKVPGEARAEVVPSGHPHAQVAVLEYRVLETSSWGSWLQIELETGRTHQIRVQAASRGHPVLGDAQYGAVVPFGVQHEDTRLRAIALHARTLEFQHPKTRDPVSATAPLSAEWSALGLKTDL